MKYYKRQLKRIEATRKLHKAQHHMLRDLIMEGFTQVTFHTTTRSITLPFDTGTTYEASAAYCQFLTDRIEKLKREASELNAQWKLELDMQEEDKKGKSAGAQEESSEQGPALLNPSTN